MSFRVARYARIAAATMLIATATTTAAPPHWPSFRGPGATGVADGHNPPTTWDVEKGTNIRWTTPIPGLAHSSPIVWDDRIYLTSAVSSDPNPYLRTGLYGESPDHPENLVHDFRVYCINKKTGKIIWETSANTGIPKVKRHIKSSHASSTPATDGKHIVAFFGSEGLYCYDTKGQLLWKKDLGLLDAGAFNASEIQWGFGSSPIIHDDMVIVQCDVNNQSFLASFDLATGHQKWRVLRDAMPAWGTPTIHSANGKSQIIINGYKHMGGYDISTGEEIWRLVGGGDIPVPTPYIAHGLIFITNGHGRLRPIYAIKPTARGDISLKEGESSNEFIAWSRPKRGSYIPTTIVYGDYLYVGDDRGILSCYDAKTGEKVYRNRLAKGAGAHSASPVAADGKLYFTAEDGQIRVIKAGPKFELLATNTMNAPCLATPAITDGMILIRTAKQLVAIGK